MVASICKSSVSRQKTFVFQNNWSKPLGYLQTFGPFSFGDVKSGSPSKSCCPEEEEVEREDCDLYKRKCEESDSSLAGKASGGQFFYTQRFFTALFLTDSLI